MLAQWNIFVSKMCHALMILAASVMQIKQILSIRASSEDALGSSQQADTQTSIHMVHIDSPTHACMHGCFIMTNMIWTAIVYSRSMARADTSIALLHEYHVFTCSNVMINMSWSCSLYLVVGLLTYNHSFEVPLSEYSYNIKVFMAIFQAKHNTDVHIHSFHIFITFL
jgi:hypothetical protein